MILKSQNLAPPKFANFSLFQFAKIKTKFPSGMMRLDWFAERYADANHRFALKKKPHALGSSILTK